LRQSVSVRLADDETSRGCLDSKIFQLHRVAGAGHLKRQSGEQDLAPGCYFTRPSPLVLGQVVRPRGGGHGPREDKFAIDRNCWFFMKKKR